jgi:general secretion pathway protein M
MFETIKQQPLYLKASQYYHSLSARDQLALKILTAFFTVLIVINSILLPSYQFAQSSQQQYRENLDDLSWMQNRRHLLATANIKSRQGSLLSIANQTSQARQISFNRFEPVGENGLNMWIENVNFNTLIQWIQHLASDQGIVVKEIAVDRQADSGTVNARIVLEG